MSVHEFPPPAGHEDDDIDFGRVSALTVETWEEFAAVKEPAAESLMGDKETCALPAGGTCLLYGKGGAGKTTLEVDWLAHLGAGDNWLGLSVARPIRVFAIENEGPRYKFREKIDEKISAWGGSPLEGRCKMLSEPWAVFDFTKTEHLNMLANVIEDHEIDLLAAGPINRLGMKGGGTPDDIGAFMAWVEALRQMLERPLAVMFAHHDNKVGDVSGAWHGVPDTLVQVKAIGPGQTLLFWEKVRWGTDLHQQTWTLSWQDGSTYEKQERTERTDGEMEADLLAYVAENDLTGWRNVRESVEGQDGLLGKIRDRLLAEGRLFNYGQTNSMKLSLNSPNGGQPPLEDIPWEVE